MDDSLRILNVTLSQATQQLRTTLAAELAAAHEITQSPAALPERSAELETTLQHLKDLQDLLTPPLYRVADGIFAFTTSAALRTAVEHRIPDLLASSGPLSTHALARQTGVSPDAIRPLLHLLADGPGILGRDAAGASSVQRPAPALASAPMSAKATIKGGGGGSDDDDDDDIWTSNPACNLLTRTHWTQWWRWVDLYATHFPELFAQLPAAASANEPRTAMQLAYGADADAPLYRVLAGVGWAGKFHAALGAGAVAMAPGMLADYPWHELGDATVCDLGGGKGDFLIGLLRENAQLRGAVLEIEGTAKLAQENIRGREGEGVRERVVRVHAGDFFEEVPAYPVYTIKWTLHNWDDERTVRILKNVKKAMVPSEVNRLLVIDSVIEPGGWQSRPALYGSVVMSAGSKGGKERTAAEWRKLAATAGWRVAQIHSLRGCIPSILDLR